MFSIATLRVVQTVTMVKTMASRRTLVPLVSIYFVLASIRISSDFTVAIISSR